MTKNEISLAEAVAQSLAVLDAPLETHTILTFDEDEEPELEEVIRCRYCESEDPGVSERGRYSLYGSVSYHSWGFEFDGYDPDYREEVYQCEECYHEEYSLDGLLEIVELPVDRE